MSNNEQCQIVEDPGRVFKPIFCYIAQDIAYRARYDCLNVCREYDNCIGKQWPTAVEAFRL